MIWTQLCVQFGVTALRECRDTLRIPNNSKQSNMK